MTQSPAEAPATEAGPLAPALYRVVERREETDDVVTLSLEPLEGRPPAFRAGQFNMLTAFGVGEVAISVSSAPGAAGALEHTVRDVGAVTHALWAAPVGSVVGVRGPFGTDWRVDELVGTDVVVVAGGIGLAPLRGAIRSLVDALRPAVPAGREEGAGRHGDTTGGGRVLVLVGARTPDQIVFGHELERWRAAGAEVEVTVDFADERWPGPVGVVTTLIEPRRFEADRTTALMCGPEVMMRFAARALLDKGLDPSRIWITLERNMQCGIGICGHCQLGPLLLCRDGPVVPYAGVLPRLLSEHEL